MDKQLQVGVKAFIRNEKGQYLVLRKNPDHNKYATYAWDIPGGRIDTGASLIDNLAREIKEETSMELLRDFEPKLIYAQDIIRETFHVVRLSYLAHADGEVVLSPEHTDFKWVSLEELKTLAGLDTFTEEVVQKGLID